MSENNKTTKNDKVSPKRRYWIAIMIIVSGFLLIAVMLGIQLIMAYNTIESIKTIVVQENFTKAQIEEIAKIYEDINKSNQTVFNIILPVLSVLLGSVVAFYFASEHLAKAQETLEKAISPEEKLSKNTVEDLMKNQPKTKGVKTITMDKATIGEVKEMMKDITNVLVVDANNRPLGVLYRWELKDKWTDSDNLVDKIEDVEKDYITQTKWTNKGIKNFATLSTDDTLLDAKKRMDAMAQSIDHRLSVRGVVVDEQEKVIGIINFANISAELI